MNAQNVEKKRWETPKVESLSVDKTLGGFIPFTVEFSFFLNDSLATTS